MRGWKTWSWAMVAGLQLWTGCAGSLEQGQDIDDQSICTATSCQPKISRVTFSANSYGVRSDEHTRQTTLGDINGDGKLDMLDEVITNDEQGFTVYQYFVRYGDGVGGFSTATEVQLNPSDFFASPVEPRIVDLNKDGLGDLVLRVASEPFQDDNSACHVLKNEYYIGTLHVHFGDANTVFRKEAQILKIGAPCDENSTTAAYEVVDVNKDQILDFVISVGNLSLQGTPYGENGISIILGKGKGAFAAPVFYRRPKTDKKDSDDTGLATADVNNDGNVDIVKLIGFKNSRLGVYLGRGDGTFAPPVERDVRAYSGSLAVGDLDGDRKADVVISGYTQDSVQVFSGTGTGQFVPAPQTTLLSGGEDTVSVELADFNLDGKLDIAAGHEKGVSILLNQGAGRFPAPSIYDSYINAPIVKAVDVNRDGRTDLLAVPYYTKAVYVMFNTSVATTAKR